MPRSRLGQLITFAIEADDDKRSSGYIWITLQKGDTVAKVASRRGHPDDARAIADLNGIRSVRTVLTRKRLRVPASAAKSESFHALAGDQAPLIADGYAKFEIVDRPERVGLSHFTGYSPTAMDVAIVFDNVLSGEGVNIEQDIRLLERMAGRGAFAGSAVGPPPVIRVSSTNGNGDVVPLIPSNYQWSSQNPTAPLWRISGLDWDAEPLRNNSGNRIRQKVTVNLQQHTSLSLASRSVTVRAKSKKKKKAKK
jgi:hypothetical protein